MASSSEADLFDNVNRSIGQFPENEPSSELDSVDRFIDKRVNIRESHESDPVPKLLLKENRPLGTENQDYAALNEQYSRKIDKLKREISLLEDEAHRQEDETLEFKDSQLQEIMKHFHGAHELTEDVDGQSSKIKINTLFFEINFTDVINKVLAHSSRQTSRRQTVWGDSYGLTFQVEFDVTETRTSNEAAAEGESHTTAKITRLKISIDGRLQGEMREFIKKVEEEKNLQLFFRSFENCCHWYQYRQKTFEYFRQLYPKIVRVLGGPNGNTIQFNHPTYSGPIFKIQWKMSVGPRGRLTPSLDLFVKAPKQLSRLDTSGTLKSMPAKFRQMVKHLGIERAIDCIIRSTSKY